MRVFVGWTDEAREEISIFMDMIPAIATYLKISPRLGQFVNKNKHTSRYLCIYLLVHQLTDLPLTDTQQSTSPLLIGEGQHLDDPSNSEYSIILGRQRSRAGPCWAAGYRGVKPLPRARAQSTVQAPHSSRPKPRSSV